VASIIEGGYSEEGLAAMSRCEDLTTIMAKELMLGIRDSVEDVSTAFRKMALTRKKERAPELTVFAALDEISADISPELTEFTGVPERYERRNAADVKQQTAAPELELFTYGEQLTIFDFAA
jgi:hypothetical protein